MVSARLNARARSRCGRWGRRSPGYDRRAGRPRWRALDADTEAETDPRIQQESDISAVHAHSAKWAISHRLVDLGRRGEGGSPSVLVVSSIVMTLLPPEPKPAPTYPRPEWVGPPRRVRWVVLGLILLALMCSACSPGAPQQVELAVGSGDRKLTFEFVASGPAVNEGLVCPPGLVEEADAREQPGFVFVLENTFLCDDETGSFVLETVIVDEPDLEGEGNPVGDWSVVSGTGSYEQLQGQGAHRYLDLSEVYAKGPINGVLQVITGEMSSG